MGKRKLFNDPIYGLVNFKFDIIYDIIDHPYFQRLRRIKQMGLSHYVYPGAMHSRFQHAIGACYLTQTALKVLQEKGIEISGEEFEATCLAVLLHDIGHGPISHSLEMQILNVHHETITEWYLDELNEQFEGKLSLCINIFKDKYNRSFLHQLVSGQLDMDRTDYLNRDSYYSGVAEGIIGYDRIISMLNVVDDKLVVEEKALFSIQKFLISREIMYKQVYLHKTSIVAEKMLAKFFHRFKEWIKSKDEIPNQILIQKSMINLIKNKNLTVKEKINYFSNLDDSDITMILKSGSHFEDPTLRMFAKSLVERKLFKIVASNSPISSDLEAELRQKVEKFATKDVDASHFLISGKETIDIYNSKKDEIIVLKKDGTLKSYSDFFPNYIDLKSIVTYYLCYLNES